MTTPELGAIEGFDPGGQGLRMIRGEEWGPLVSACLDDGAPTLRSTPGNIPAESATYDLAAMRPVARREYEIACNWKTYVDNFLEGDHLPTVHPGLFRELDYGKYRVETFANDSSPIAPIRAPAEGARGRQVVAAGEEELAALYYGSLRVARARRAHADRQRPWFRRDTGRPLSLKRLSESHRAAACHARAAVTGYLSLCTPIG